VKTPPRGWIEQTQIPGEQQVVFDFVRGSQRNPNESRQFTVAVPSATLRKIRRNRCGGSAELAG
jgi:hypothetical protein